MIRFQMKFFVVCLFFLFSTSAYSKNIVIQVDTIQNPLSMYSSQWLQTKYREANTAEDAEYLTREEKNIIWILNMLRLNPALFCRSVLLNPKSKYFEGIKERDYYFKSLVTHLEKMEPSFSLLQPDKEAYQSAYCHALYSGKTGYVGHERNSDCKEDFFGECCDYGFSDGLSIVIHLLIDRDVEGVGHRKICLSRKYSLLGTSIQPHKIYHSNAVLDFK